jgi:hypothetical protein
MHFAVNLRTDMDLIVRKAIDGVEMMAGGEGPSSPKAPRPYRQALCAPF